MLAITEEDYPKPTCEGQGSLQTWRITDERNADGTIKLELLDLWTTELNELANQTGRSPATGNCSAHWFDEDGGLLAQGWYDQGVRFLDISNPRNIRQVGYYATTGHVLGAPTSRRPIPSTRSSTALDVTSRASTSCTSTAPARCRRCARPRASRIFDGPARRSRRTRAGVSSVSCPRRDLRPPSSGVTGQSR